MRGGRGLGCSLMYLPILVILGFSIIVKLIGRNEVALGCQMASLGIIGKYVTLLLVKNVKLAIWLFVMAICNGNLKEVDFFGSRL